MNRWRYYRINIWTRPSIQSKHNINIKSIYFHWLNNKKLIKISYIALHYDSKCYITILPAIIHYVRSNMEILWKSFHCAASVLCNIIFQYNHIWRKLCWQIQITSIDLRNKLFVPLMEGWFATYFDYSFGTDLKLWTDPM